MIERLIGWFRRLFDTKTINQDEHPRVKYAEIKSPVTETQRPIINNANSRDLLLLNVGIDYGTSSTKIVVRDIMKNKSTVLSLDEGMDGLPGFAIPSTVTISEGNLFFGSRAEKLITGRKFRSLKVCLACQFNLLPCRNCEPKKLAVGVKNGFFLVSPESEKQCVISSEIMVVAHVSYIMKSVYRWLEQHYPDYDRSVTFNVSAPLDQLDVTRIEKNYNYLFFLAEKLVNKIEQGMHLEELLRYYNDTKTFYPVLPDDSERNVFVQPETVAAVMPYTRSTSATDGLYAIADVGAGTTDISFFRLGGMPRQLSFYYAKSYPVGGDNFDRQLESWIIYKMGNSIGPLQMANGELLEVIRKSKHQFESKGKMSIIHLGAEVEISASELKDICAASIREIYKTYDQAWMGAFRKEEIQSRWKLYHIAFLGGGSRLSQVRKSLLNPPRSFIKQTLPINVKPDEPFSELSPKQGADLERNIDLLYVAYGLSFSQPEFAKVRFPRHVKPLQRFRSRLSMPDRDELYPK